MIQRVGGGVGMQETGPACKSYAQGNVCRQPQVSCIPTQPQTLLISKYATRHQGMVGLQQDAVLALESELCSRRTVRHSVQQDRQ